MKKLIDKFKKINKKHKIIIILLVACIVIPSIYVLGKYVINLISEHYYESKNFYFNSNILNVSDAYYEVDNWSGVSAYEFEVDITNMANELEYSEKDVLYDLEITCPETVTCSTDFPFGGDTLEGEVAEKRTWTVSVAPQGPITTAVEVKVKAKATSPYTKTISASIKLSTSGITYKINDKVNQIYSMLILNNDLDTAKNVTLLFDPNLINIDMTNSLVLNNSNYSTTTINSKAYINQITINLAANSSSYIFFYKNDITNDYTYPFINEIPIITIQ